PADAHRLYDGDIEHAMRRRAGGERPAAARERHLRQSAMAVVQHCRHGGRDPRRPAGPASVAGRCAARRRGDRRGGARGGHRRDFVSGAREKSRDRPARHEKHARRPEDVVPSARALAHRRVHVPLLFQSRIEHAALFHHDRQPALLPRLYRHFELDRGGGLGVGGAALSPLSREMTLKNLLNLSIALGTLATAAFLLLTNEASAAVIYFCSGFSAMLATVATRTLAAEYCPPRAEGFAFPGLRSIINLATSAADNV